MTSTVVYFVQIGEDGPIKIGFTSDFARRLPAIEPIVPGPKRPLLVTAGDRDDEYALHQRFAAHRIAREWFRPANELISFIADAQARGALWADGEAPARGGGAAAEVARVVHEANENGAPMGEIAARAGITPQALSRALSTARRGAGDARLSTLCDIARAVGHRLVFVPQARAAEVERMIEERRRAMAVKGGPS